MGAVLAGPGCWSASWPRAVAFRCFGAGTCVRSLGKITGRAFCRPAPHGSFSESLGAGVATKAPGFFLALYICARFVARLKANQPSPVLKAWGFAVWASPHDFESI